MRGRTHSVGVVVSHGRDGTLDGTDVAHPTQPPTRPLPYHSPALPFDAMTAAGPGPLHDLEMDTKRLGFSQWCA